MAKGITKVAGMDLGDRRSEVAVVTMGGQIVERRSVEMQSAKLREYFGERPGMRVVIEASTGSPWVSRLLKECEQEVVVVNPHKMRMVSASVKKTDRTDAMVLATMGRLGGEELWTVRHRSEKVQADLAVVNARAALVAQRTALVNQCRGTMKSFGYRLPKLDTDYFGKERLSEAIPELLRPALWPLLEELDGLTRRIKAYDVELERLCEEYPETKHLVQINGVGMVTALSFVLKIEDPERFKNSRAVGAYLGMVPRLDQSGGTEKQLKLSKAGDKDLRVLLVQCAQHILGKSGQDSRLRRWGLARIPEGNKRQKRIIVAAVARKLAVLLHHLWVSKEAYNPFHGMSEEEILAGA